MSIPQSSVPLDARPMSDSVVSPQPQVGSDDKNKNVIHKGTLELPTPIRQAQISDLPYQEKAEPQQYAPSKPELTPSAKPAKAIKLKRGLDLPIAGEPAQKIVPGPTVNRVAVVGPDYVGMKPTMAVEEGDQVVTGQVLFRDKKQPGVCYTSPGCGKVVAIHRGAKRVLLSVVIELEGSDNEYFTSYSDRELDSIKREDVIRQLVDSGAWTSLRERPFDRVPSPMAFGPLNAEEEAADAVCESAVKLEGVLQLVGKELDGNASICPNSATCSGSCSSGKIAEEEGSQAEADSEANLVPSALFITAIDTRPLAADPEVVIGQRTGYFYDGLRVLGRLGIAKNYLCTAPGARIPGDNLPHIERAEFAGPHPAGLVGTHIHTLAPAGRNRRVWHINYQDVIAIGRLFRTGKIDTERVVSLAGPSVKQPRLIRTRVGADLNELLKDQLIKDSDEQGKHRVVSGSVLAGRSVAGKHVDASETAFLGRYDLQISVLPEFENRELFGWITPGLKKFSVKNVVFSKLLGRKRRFAFDTAVHGGRRAIVPIGAYQKVMPLDILPDFLLKALSIGDLELSESLGCLELTEEDVALLTYVCPGKADYGVMLRRVLDEIAKEM